MHRKQDLYNEVVAFRKDGLSYNEIIGRVVVSRSTLSRWCRDILLTEEQQRRLWEKRVNNSLIKNKIQQARSDQENANNWAKTQLEKFVVNDNILLISGIILYWAEGTRIVNFNSIEFTNTDSNIIKIMISFFLKILKVSYEKLKIKVRIGDQGNVKKAEEYWGKITGINSKNFQRPEIIQLPKKSKSLKKNPHGICRISIYNSLAYRKLLALIREFSAKFSPP